MSRLFYILAVVGLYLIFLSALPKKAYSQSRIIAVKELKPYKYEGCVTSIVNLGEAQPGNRVLRYKLTYRTVSAHGHPTVASGLVAFTDEALISRTMVNYNHATVVDKSNVPTESSWESSYALCTLITKENVIVASDYLGLGDSTESFQSYLHLPSQVVNNVHLFEAAEELLNSFDIRLEKQVVLAGYSQGAHVALATHQYLDQRGHRGWNVTATVAMSGPFSLSSYGLHALSYKPKKGKSALFTALIIFGYQNIYGNLFDTVEEIFRPKYQDFLGVMATQDRDTISKFLPEYPHELLNKKYLDDLLRDESHPLKAALKANDILPWQASGEVLFVYSDGDETVLSDNSHSMAEELANRGTIVHKHHVGKKFSHVSAFIPAIHASRTFIQSLFLETLPIDAPQ